MQGICILGSTGSIGIQTLDVISQYPNLFNVVVLAGNRSVEKIFSQCKKFLPKYVHMADECSAIKLQSLIAKESLNIEVLTGHSELLELVKLQEVSKVMAAMSGSVGLQPVLSALSADKTVLLANKEPMVMAGRWVLEALKKSKGSILPVDSEHNSIYQVLGEDYKIGCTIDNLHKIILTASGGPFWRHTKQQLNDVTLAEALVHPTWSMGSKITIDSATLMNKGLELIEAKWLFNLTSEQLDVLIHPQSIVHSFVAYKDGAQIAQLGVPDMRLSIGYCLNPKRNLETVNELLLANKQLEFFPACPKNFKALQLAYNVLDAGNEAACVYNAANEIAVEHFLQNKIKFVQIVDLVEDAINHFGNLTCNSIDEIISLDSKTRIYTNSLIKKQIVEYV
jgi:1-deoxy-D-xylulose-5-phosphate reductoisomerase